MSISRQRVAECVAVVVVLSAGVVAGGQEPAFATSGTITLTAICDGAGEPGGFAALEEHLSGLPTSQPYGFAVSGTRDVTGGTDTWSEASWGTDDGSHNATVTVGLGVTSQDSNLVPGDTYNYTLTKTYGGSSTELSGQLTVGGGGCTKPPKKARLGNSPGSITVSKKGSFVYPFKASPALHGTVTVTRKTATWATRSVIVPSTGKAKPKLTLTHKAFKALKKAGKATTKVAVTLKQAGKSSTAHASLTLKAP